MLVGRNTAVRAVRREVSPHRQGKVNRTIESRHAGGTTLFRRRPRPWVSQPKTPQQQANVLSLWIRSPPPPCIELLHPNLQASHLQLLRRALRALWMTQRLIPWAGRSTGLRQAAARTTANHEVKLQKFLGPKKKNSASHALRRYGVLKQRGADPGIRGHFGGPKVRPP